MNVPSAQGGHIPSAPLGTGYGIGTTFMVYHCLRIVLEDAVVVGEVSPEVAIRMVLAVNLTLLCTSGR